MDITSVCKMKKPQRSVAQYCACGWHYCTVHLGRVETVKFMLHVLYHSKTLIRSLTFLRDLSVQINIKTMSKKFQSGTVKNDFWKCY